MYYKTSPAPKQRRRPYESTRVIALGFAACILLGAVLLTLPVSASDGRSIGFFDALFTATSAVCVTGLSVLDISRALSRFGQVVLMLLIQVGGLGFMVFGMGLLLALGRRITLRERMLIRASMNSDHLNGGIALMRWVLFLSLGVELAGAALLAIRFVPRYGAGEGLFYALFHAVSAFCNAGFDLFGDSLIGYANDPLVLGTIMLLIVTGGLGFAAIADIKNRDGMELHTRVVLAGTGALLLIGFLVTLALEWGGVFAGATTGGKLLGAAFQSVTLRTAGFTTFDQSNLSSASKIVSDIWMFIGASPASTGGGVKVTTFTVIALYILAAARGREEPVIAGRRLAKPLLLRAMAVFSIALAVVLVESFLLCVLEPSIPMENLVYEAVSAFATVGLSCSVTPSLGAPARLTLILVMFLGRVGPLTLTLAIAKRQSVRQDAVQYPEAHIMLG